MKKIAVFVMGMLCLGTTFVAAQAANKITNTRILQATKDTTITYAGVKVFVPAGQTVVLGQSSNGNMILRGQNLSGVKVGSGTLSSRGPVVLTVQPETQVIRVAQGNNVQVTDGNGRMAEISAGAAVSAKDIRERVNSMAPAAMVTTVVAEEEVVAPVQKPAAKPAAKPAVTVQQEETVAFEVPAFVAATSASEASVEQAVQNVEDTLSPSTPR